MFHVKQLKERIGVMERYNAAQDKKFQVDNDNIFVVTPIFPELSKIQGDRFFLSKRELKELNFIPGPKHTFKLTVWPQKELI